MTSTAVCILIAVLSVTVPLTSALNHKGQGRGHKFLNGLYDSIPVSAMRQLKQMVGSEQYSLLKITAGDNLSASEQTGTENVGLENLDVLEKNVELTLRDCERHHRAGQGPCWNLCQDPILTVKRHGSQPINPDGHEGPNRIERIIAVICPWHIRAIGDHESQPHKQSSFSTPNITIVRSRGSMDLKNKVTDDAAHLIPSLLGGLPDIDRNAFAQADRPALQHYRRSEQYIAKFLQYKSPKDGSRMAMYDIVLNYEDSTGMSATSTRPVFVHYVDSYYEYQTDESFKLVEISTETQDNTPVYIQGKDREDL